MESGGNYNKTRIKEWRNDHNPVLVENITLVNAECKETVVNTHH